MTSGNPFYDKLLAAHSEDKRPFLLTPGGAHISYGEAHARTLVLAGYLQQCGVKPGDRVAVQTAKSDQALLLYLACMTAGAVYLPLNTAYTPNELNFFLNDARPTLFVCDPRLDLGTLQFAPTAHPLVARLNPQGEFQWPDAANIADAAPCRPQPREPSDLAAILYTSGTTGRSKGAMLSYGNLLSNATTLVQAWEFNEQDSLLHALPIFHTHGLFVATNVCIAAGARILLLPRFDPEAVLRALPQCSVMMGVPTFYTRLLDHVGFNAASAAGMRLFISGSAPLLRETHQAFESRCGHRILERYGMTETNMLTSNPYRGERRPGTVGPPLPGVDVKVVNPETGIPLPAGETGSIEVRGTNVFSGYWQLPEKTAEEFRPDGFFITGDLGYFDDDGYVVIIGRGKDLVITGGFNVYPKEVEDIINAADDVLESAVIGLPHPDFGEAVTALVVLARNIAGNTSAIERVLEDSLEQALANYKRPKRLLFVPGLPRNTMGKVQKNLLRTEYATLFNTSDED